MYIQTRNAKAETYQSRPWWALSEHAAGCFIDLVEYGVVRLDSVVLVLSFLYGVSPFVGETLKRVFVACIDRADFVNPLPLEVGGENVKDQKLEEVQQTFEG